MNEPVTDKINIYITVDMQTVSFYFNAHDPSPLYKKQINQQFERYIVNSVKSAKRYTAIFYKINCPGAVDKQYAEPLLYAIQRHFAYKKTVREKEFKKFKRNNFFLLAVSSLIVIICEAFLPLFFSEHASGIYDGLKNCLDVFSWVILWRPIYELLFEWNPFLKDILLLKKLSTAEVIFIDNKKNGEAEQPPVRYNAPDDVKVNKPFALESLLSN